jgi:site-specific recombinase XerD
VREHRRRTRKATEPNFELDVVVPGLGAITGRGDDRFRCSAETRDRLILAERRNMAVDLGRRLLHDVLAARLAGRFSTEALALAYKQGEPALRALTDASRHALLSELRDRWMTVCGAVSRDNYRRQVDAFIAYCGGPAKASVADLTPEKIATWLASLQDSRPGRVGRRASSTRAEAMAARRRRRHVRQVARAQQARAREEAGRTAGVAPPPDRPVAPATRNRYRAALSAFCTYLVNTAGALATHPLRAGRLPSVPEADGRMPHVSASEWADYRVALATDPLAPDGSVLVADVLRHTGADVGEVLGHVRRNGTVIPGLSLGDVEADRRLPRIRFKRSKVARSPERAVPFAARFVPALLRHAATRGLRLNDPLFGGVERAEFERAHRRAARAIGRPDLRLKDLRHLAAISWARAGVRLERIKDWLGHTRITQTEVYARFAPDDDFDEPAVERAADLVLVAPTNSRPLVPEPRGSP